MSRELSEIRACMARDKIIAGEDEENWRAFRKEVDQRWVMDFIDQQLMHRLSTDLLEPPLEQE